jgi:hypothetical protein
MKILVTCEEFLKIIDKNNHNNFLINSMIFQTQIKSEWKRSTIVENFFIQSTKIIFLWDEKEKIF